STGRAVSPSIPDALPSCPAAATRRNRFSWLSATEGRQAASSTNDATRPEDDERGRRFGKVRAARCQGAQEVFPHPPRASAKDDRLREGGGRCELLPQSRRNTL